MPESVIRALSFWDYAVIGFYLCFVGSIGFICQRVNRSASDYFRGGGNMLWWVSGMSALAAGISTWSFTGGAAKCYNDGFVYPISGLLTMIPSLIVGLLLAPRFRRMRVITAMEAVFRRFGFGTEQFYTWFSLPMGLFWGGIGLNTLGVFMSSSFHFDLNLTIIVAGLIVMLMATLGGQWAVSLGGVVQGLLLFLMVTVVAFFSVNLPEIGGVTNLFNALPEHHLKFDTNASAAIVWLWIGWNTITTVLNAPDIRNCGKFVRVKDDRHARLMMLMIAAPGLFLLWPVVSQLPAMCAATVFPDLKSMFPTLQRPEEAAWVAMAFKVLPQGLLGLLICAMFSAATDTLDAALNSNAGFFVRNVYIRYVHPTASEKQQVIVGKITTLTFGLLIIGLALGVNSLRTLNLFDLFQILNAMLLPPMIVPMVLGLFIRRTPAWTGWSTVIAGLVASVIAKAMFDPQWVSAMLEIERPLNEREIVDAQFVFVSVLSWLGATAWFLGTMAFWKQSSPEHHARVESLFADMNRPIDRVAEGGENQDQMQYRIVGALCAILGIFLLLCMLIPNPAHGRLAFLFVGGVMTAIGLNLWRIATKKAALPSLPTRDVAAVEVAPVPANSP